MADLNSITITGRLTKDAELVTLASGKTILKCSVACNTGFGQYATTTYFKVNQWLNDSDCKIKQYLVKGVTIGCTGEFSVNQWTAQSGDQMYEPTIKTFGIQILKFAENTTPPNSSNSNVESPTDSESKDQCVAF